MVVCVADGSEVGLGAPPSTGIAKPAGVLGGRGVAVPGHVACADHGRQDIIVCRIRPCVAETSLAKSWDGVLAADRDVPRSNSASLAEGWQVARTRHYKLRSLIDVHENTSDVFADDAEKDHQDAANEQVD